MRTTLAALLLCACGSELNAVGPKAEAPPSSPERYRGSEGPLTSPCDFDLPKTRGVLVGSTQNEAFLVRADGTRVALVPAPPAGLQRYVGAPHVRGEFVSLATTDVAAGQYVSRVLLFDAEGTLLASAEDTNNSYLSELGLVATWSPKGGLMVLRADGTSLNDPALTPAGEFGPAGVLPVWRTKDEASRSLALLDVTTHEVTSLPIAVVQWSQPIWAGDVLVYLGERDGVVMVVRHGGGQTLTTPLEVDLTNGVQLEQIAGDSVVLVSGSWVQVRTRVDLKTGAVTPLDVELPAGVFFAGRHSAQLADDGSLVAALQQNGSAGLFRSLDGKSWTPMGGAVKDATVVQFAGKKGTWLMSAAGALGWSTSTSLGLIPSMGRAVALPKLANAVPTEDAVSSDGRCAAVWTGSGTAFSLVAVDLVRGTERKLADSAVRPTTAVWLR